MPRLGPAWATCFAIVALACGGSQPDPESAARAQPKPEPLRTAAEDRDLRMLLVDATAERGCEHLAGQFMALSAGEQPPSTEQTEKQGSEPKSGRLWIERCRAQRESGDQVSFELGGRGWRWVDKQSKKAGAKFKVSQYVKFSAEIKAHGTVDLTYARLRKVLTMMLTTTEPVRVKLSPIGKLDAEPQGSWAWLLGAASSIVDDSPDKQASQKFQTQGSKQFAEQLTYGYTVAIDLCSGQKYETIGRLPEGDLPKAALPAPGRIWSSNDRIELMPGGLDLAGPFRQESLPITFAVDVEDGDPVVSQVVHDGGATGCERVLRR